jgi:hypothetical protein
MLSRERLCGNFSHEDQACWLALAWMAFYVAMSFPVMNRVVS